MKDEDLVTVIIAVDDTEDGWILTWSAPDAELADYMHEEVNNGGRSLDNGWGHIGNLSSKLDPGVYKIRMFPGGSGPDIDGEYDSWWTLDSEPELLYGLPELPENGTITPEEKEKEETELIALVDELT